MRNNVIHYINSNILDRYYIIVVQCIEEVAKYYAV